MTGKQRKALGRALLTIARSSRRLADAGTFSIAGIYREELEKIEKASLDAVESLRDSSKDDG